MNIKRLPLFSFCFFALFAVSSHAQSVSVVNDTLPLPTADLDAAYFGTSTANALQFTTSGPNDEITNSIGLVSGPSGRQIHAIFDTVTIGDSLTASITFITPPTTFAEPSQLADPVNDTSGDNDLRFGLFDTLDRATALSADQTSDSDNPNPLLFGLPGIVTELDVEGPVGSTSSDTDRAAADVNTRQSNPSTTGVLLGTNNTVGSVSSSSDNGYVFDPLTTYTLTMTLTRVASESGAADDDIEVVTTFDIVDQGQVTTIDSHDDILTPTVSLTATGTITGTNGMDTPFDTSTELSYSFGMLGTGASTDAFGSSNAFSTPEDNGIEIIAFTVDADIAGGGAPVDAEETCFPIGNEENGLSVV